MCVYVKSNALVILSGIQRSITSLKIIAYSSEKESVTLLSWVFICSFCFFIWIASKKVEVGLIRARVQSGRIRKDFEQLVVESGQHTIRKELQELKKIVHAVIPTAKGEEERETIETWVERLEVVCKRLEKCLSDLYTEESVNEGLEQDTTSVGKSSNQISAALRDLVENLKMIYESWREFTDGMADRSQKDTEQICEEQRKCDEVTIEVLYEGGFKLNEIV